MSVATEVSAKNNEVLSNKAKQEGTRQELESSTVKSSSRISNNDAPNKIKLGKANPLRDILLLFSILGFLLWMTIDLDYVEKDEQETKKIQEKSWLSLTYLEKLADGLNDAHQALVSMSEKSHEKGKRREYPCSLYASLSSIPGAAQSLFAGQDYDINDIIIPASALQGLVPLHLDANDPMVFLAPHAFLLKHHPLLVNVHGKLVTESSSGGDAGIIDTDLGSFELRALKPIPAGSELFVSFEDHPHSILHQHPLIIDRLFGHIPTAADYQLADEIESDAHSAMRAIQVMNARTFRKTVATTPLYPAMKRAIGRVNHKIFLLLPDNSKKAEPYRKASSSLASLKNRTLDHLQGSGFCLSDDIIIQLIGEEERAAAGRDIDKGETMSVVHLHVLRNPMTCYSADNNVNCLKLAANCFGQLKSQVLLCPLLSPMNLVQQQQQQRVIADDSIRPNVEVRWTDKSMSQKTVQDLVDYSVAGSMSLSIVALEKIEKGQELRFKNLPEEWLIPKEWNIPDDKS